MTKKEILEGEKLIASYMGYVYYPYNQEEASKGLLFGWIKPEQRKPNLVPKHRPVLARKHSDLKFIKSWDWLIPVIKRIREIVNTNLSIDEYHNTVRISQQLNPYDYDIQSIFKAVVEFIKWYNQYKNE